VSTVFVTGGSGFLGSRLVPKLVSDGYEVRALARSSRAEQILLERGAVPVTADLTDVRSLSTAMSGCNRVIHAAARLHEGGPRAKFHRDNVVGTQNVLAGAKDAGVERFVMVGAAMCLLGGRPINGADESWPLNEPKYSAYASTKTIADRAVRAANRDGFATCVVRPGWIWGNGDPVLGAIVKAASVGKMRLIEGGEYLIETSHVDNTVHAIALALERGRGGEAYYAFDDGNVSIKDFIGDCLNAIGMERPTKSVSRRAAWVVGTLMDGAWSVFRRPGTPPLSRLMVALNGAPFLVLDTKARSELGYKPVIARAEGILRLADTQLKASSADAVASATLGA
jgi:nucleoside-diphosphate-sugar epimerase